VQNEKSRILAQLQRHRDARPGRLWATAIVGGLSLFGMVAAFGTAPSSEQVAGLTRSVIEQLATPAIEPFDSSDQLFVREERVQRGDTVANLLSRLGLEDDAVLGFLRTTPEAAMISRQMSPGKQVTARVDGDGKLSTLIFPLNGGNDRALVVERDGADALKVTESALPLETRVLMKSAQIRYSLFGAADAADIPDSVATQLADIFGGDIDFHRDLRKGDRFSVVYESISYLGRMMRTGRILAAEFVNDDRTYRAVWFEDEDGKGGYYTADGKNIRKAFLRSPLEFSRITSGFSISRYHPILHTQRAHTGVDYGAPVGTRVKATGDGVVEFVGSQGGYGKVVMLRHQSQYLTVYGHLSGYAPGLRKGNRVGQGAVIGYVGATGLATGPHLHYEFRVNGAHRNPLAVVLPEAPPLTALQLPRFRDRSQAVLASLNMISGGNLALLD
jgi:murein DD-endopeptidase MepM/ murein hydrolase activator NlpD